MRVLGFSAITYIGDFWKEALLSIEPFVDKFHVSFSHNPSHGFSTMLENPDREYEIRKIAEEVLKDKLIWDSAEGYTSEIEHRNQRYKHSIGYSLLVQIDPDEIFDINLIPSALRCAYEGSERFYGTPYFIHFWKSLNWCFYNDGDTPIRIENLLRDNLLVNTTCPLKVYHTNMMQPEEILHFKFDCYGHKNEIKSNYMQDKFLAWSPEKIDEITHLHPTKNNIWIKPEIFQGELPEVLKNYQPKIKHKMRILLIPLDFQRHSENPELFTDMLNSFLTVADTMIYHGDLGLAINFKPDLILFQGSLSLPDCIVLKNETRALFCMMSGDCRYAPLQSLMDYKNVVDAYFLPFSGQLLDTYTTLLEKPCHFLWEYIQNWRFKTPKMMEYKALESSYITFVGNVYEGLPGGQSRLEIAEFLEKYEPNLLIRGNGFPSYGELVNDAVPETYNNSYIVIAENNHTVEDYFTPRNLGGLAAGSCTLMKYFPGIEKFFQNLVHCIYYRDKYELLQWIEFLRNNAQIRNEIASNGYGLALTNFSIDKWVKDFLTIINKNYIK